MLSCTKKNFFKWHHKYILENKIVWKSGLVIKKDKTIAEIIENYKSREININVLGENKKDLLIIVIHKLEEIHDSFNNQLKYELKVPCNCTECKLSTEPFYYNYSIIKNFITKNCSLIQCQKSTISVNVIGLIDDIFDEDSSQIKNFENKTFTINAENSTFNISENGSEITVKNSINILNNVDLKELNKELLTLKELLVKKELYNEAQIVKEAIETEDEEKKIGFLKKAGIKTLKLVEGISLPIISEVLMKMAGIN